MVKWYLHWLYLSGSWKTFITTLFTILLQLYANVMLVYFFNEKFSFLIFRFIPTKTGKIA